MFSWPLLAAQYNKNKETCNRNYYRAHVNFITLVVRDGAVYAWIAMSILAGIFDKHIRRSSMCILDRYFVFILFLFCFHCSQ